MSLLIVCAFALLLTIPPAPMLNGSWVIVNPPAPAWKPSEAMLQGESTSDVSRVRPAKLMFAVPLLAGANSLVQLRPLLQLLSLPAPFHTGAGADQERFTQAAKIERMQTQR